MNYSLLDSSVHGISQARILDWGAISFSRGSSRLGDWLPHGQVDSSPISHLGSPSIYLLGFKMRDNKQTVIVGYQSWDRKHVTSEKGIQSKTRQHLLNQQQPREQCLLEVDPGHPLSPSRQYPLADTGKVVLPASLLAESKGLGIDCQSTLEFLFFLSLSPHKPRGCSCYKISSSSLVVA